MPKQNSEAARSDRGTNEVTFVYNHLRYEIDVDVELAIDPQDLLSAFIDQAGKFAWYAAVHAAAMKRVDKTKTLLDMVRASIDVAKSKASIRLKEEMTDVKSKKPPSQNAIDAIIDAQPEVLEARAEVAKAQEVLVQARYEQEVVRSVKDAFKHRRDMLKQLGWDVRQEQHDAR